MSFKPNAIGLYDMGGNVEEWCDDWFDSQKTRRLARGTYFGSAADLESTSGGSRLPTNHYYGTGFRCVMEWDAAMAGMREKDIPPAKFPEPLPPAEVAQRSLTNSLGMKFVPVPGTEVLFAIHETRRKDYAAFVAETGHRCALWKNQQRYGLSCGGEDNHPIVGVAWKDARAFCDWLNQKEGCLYRLPTDREWSMAVGLGPYEPSGDGITPATLGHKGRTELP